MESLFEKMAAISRPAEVAAQGNRDFNSFRKWVEAETNFIKKTANYTPSEYERGYAAALQDAQKWLTSPTEE